MNDGGTVADVGRWQWMTFCSFVADNAADGDGVVDDANDDTADGEPAAVHVDPVAVAGAVVVVGDDDEHNDDTTADNELGIERDADGVDDLDGVGVDAGDHPMERQEGPRRRERCWRNRWLEASCWHPSS